MRSNSKNERKVDTGRPKIEEFETYLTRKGQALHFAPRYAFESSWYSNQRISTFRQSKLEKNDKLINAKNLTHENIANVQREFFYICSLTEDVRINIKTQMHFSSMKKLEESDITNRRRERIKRIILK
jgi:hypothetical protein